MRHRRAAVNLGALLSQQGDASGAKAAYQLAINSGQADAAPNDALDLGILLADKGDISGARAAYQRAISSGSAVVRLEAARLLAELP